MPGEGEGSHSSPTGPPAPQAQRSPFQDGLRRVPASTALNPKLSLPTASTFRMPESTGSREGAVSAGATDLHYTTQPVFQHSRFLRVSQCYGALTWSTGNQPANASQSTLAQTLQEGWATATHVGNRTGWNFWLLHLAWTSPGCCGSSGDQTSR